jgi:hypothetical protein
LTRPSILVRYKDKSSTENPNHVAELGKGKGNLKENERYPMHNCHENPIMPPPRGGAPVSFIEEMSPVESYAISFLRLWCSGPKSKQKVVNELVMQLGLKQGYATTDCLDKICQLLTENARRPLMYHDVLCDCVGAHEACFANFIRLAAKKQKKDAMIFACLLVNSTLLGSIYDLGEEFGLALKLITSPAQVLENA